MQDNFQNLSDVIDYSTRFITDMQFELLDKLQASADEIVTSVFFKKKNK